MQETFENPLSCIYDRAQVKKVKNKACLLDCITWFNWDCFQKKTTRRDGNINNMYETRMFPDDSSSPYDHLQCITRNNIHQ